jgi:predicted dehydrogenase
MQHSVDPQLNVTRFSLCVVGCGQYAADFAGSLAEVSDEIDLFFASREYSRAAEYCHRFGGQGCFGSYRQAAEDDRIDALYVCTPHHLHRKHCELGIGHGKHILVEKPLAHSLKDAGAIVRTARNSNITLMVAENVRYMAQVRKCRELVADGLLGSSRFIQFQEEFPFQAGGWRSREADNGGGLLIDGGIHKAHFMRYLAGEPETVFASTLPRAMAGQEGEDGMAVMLRWPTGAVGMIYHSWTPGKPSPPSVRVAGSRGSISFVIGDGQLALEQGGHQEVFRFPPGHRGIPAMVREFIACVREQRECQTSGGEGLKDLALVMAAYESARNGTVVDFADYLRSL